MTVEPAWSRFFCNGRETGAEIKLWRRGCIIHLLIIIEFGFLQKDGNDRMDFISDVDIGHVEKPSSWSDALAVLKENYATSMVVRAFADCFQKIVYVVTANGVSGHYLIQVYYTFLNKKLLNILLL